MEYPTPDPLGHLGPRRAETQCDCDRFDLHGRAADVARGRRPMPPLGRCLTEIEGASWGSSGHAVS